MKTAKLVTAYLAASCMASVAMAANIYKTNNNDNLNLATSWTNNVAPGTADVAVWDSTVSDQNNTTNILGASASWLGLRILNPVAGITIATNAGGAVLTIGASGIDLSGASQSLTLSNATTLLGANAQSWKVNSGGSVLVGGPLTRSAQATVDFDNSAGGTITIASGTASSPLNYATVNKTDFAALDSSKNVTPGASVLTYTPNPSANPSSISGTFAVIDVVNSNPNGAPSAFRLSNNTTVTTGVRFNTPNVNNIDWVIDANTRNFNFSSGACLLVTPNVGAQNVIETDSSTGFRFSAGAEMVVAQHNTNGDFILNGHITASSGTVNVTKTGAGRFLINVVGGNNIGLLVEQGTVLVNGTIPSASTVNNGAFLGGRGTVANVTVANGGSLLPGNNGTNATGALTLNGSLTLNAGTNSISFYSPTVPTTNVNALLIVNSNLTVNSSAVNISIKSGKAAVGQYPLLKWTNVISAPVFSVFNLAAMPPHVSGYLSNNLATFSIDLVVTNINEPLKWATGNGTWDIGITANWKDTFGAFTTYQEANGVGDTVVFEDSLSGASPTVTLNSAPIPSSVTVTNNTKSYTITGSGSISGSGSLTKSGSGALTLGTANSFTGGINLNGGTVNFSALANLGAGAISFGGGTLKYNSGNFDDISVRAVTFNAGGATIDTTGQSINYANPVGSGGAGGLTLTAGSLLTLNGTNRYTGATLVNAGATLYLGAATYISNSSSITLSTSTAFLDVSASGSITLGTAAGQTLAGVGTVNGNVVCPTGTSISPGSSAGTLTMNDLTMSGGTNVLDISTVPAQRDLIVAGNLTLTSGTIRLVAANALNNGVYKLIQYSGALNSGPGSSGNLALTVTGVAQPGKALTLSDATAGEIDLIVADNASDVITWAGAGANWDTAGTANWFLGVATPWAFTNGDLVTFDEIGVAQSTVQLQGVFLPSNVIVSNETATYTFADGTGTGGGKISGTTKLTKKGPGTLIIQTDNNNSGATDIQNGTLQVGNASIGDTGTGNITNNGALVFQQNASRTVAGVISGSGPLTQQGSATLSLAQNNTYRGLTTISTGTLQVGTGGTTGTLGTNEVVDNAALSFNRSAALIVSNAISGTGSLSVNGSGTFTLVASNNYTGGTAINAGKLVLGSATAISGEGNFTVQAAGTNDLNGNNLVVTRLNNANPASGAGGRIVNNAGTATTTNLVVIDYNGTGTADNSIAILDNEGTGGRIAVLKINTGSQIMRGNSTYTGGTVVSNGTLNLRAGTPLGSGLVTLRGGNLTVAAITFSNPIQADTNATIDINGNATINGNITTTSNLTVAIDGNETVTWNGAATQLAGVTGTIFITPGPGFFRFNASRGSANATFDLTGSSATINSVGTGTFELGALVGDGTSFIGASGTSTFVIGGKNLSTTYSGTLNANANNLTKVGTGTLTLDGTIGFTGTTTVSNGVLAIAGAANLDTMSTIAVRSGGTLDVNGIGGTLNLGNVAVQNLNGSGTINGSVSAGVNSVINPGDAIGFLTITNICSISGTNLMELNRTNSPNSDRIIADSFVINPGATLIVLNLGSTNLTAGDTFTLFSKPLPSAFTTVTLPALPCGGLSWVNNLTVNGTISVTGTPCVSTTPPTITNSVSGNTLTLSWPADHIGWRLQVQTNLISVGLRGNWFDVAGSTTVSTMNFTINPANGSVFYRMVYP